MNKFASLAVSLAFVVAITGCSSDKASPRSTAPHGSSSTTPLQSTSISTAVVASTSGAGAVSAADFTASVCEAIRTVLDDASLSGAGTAAYKVQFGLALANILPPNATPATVDDAAVQTKCLVEYNEILAKTGMKTLHDF